MSHGGGGGGPKSAGKSVTYYLNGPLGPATTTINGQITLIGIVSFGMGNCSLQFPVGFARVTHQLNWIKKNSDVDKFQCINRNNYRPSSDNLETY